VDVRRDDVPGRLFATIWNSTVPLDSSSRGTSRLRVPRSWPLRTGHLLLGAEHRDEGRRRRRAREATAAATRATGDEEDHADLLYPPLSPRFASASLSATCAGGRVVRDVVLGEAGRIDAFARPHVRDAQSRTAGSSGWPPWARRIRLG
jgi:hypothetical protein